MGSIAPKTITLPAAVFILGCLLAQPSVSTGHPQSAFRHDPDVLIRMTGDRFSLTTIATPWPLVLEEFRRRTGVVLHVVPPPVGAVTVSIENVGVETALRRLFGVEAGFVYLYRPGPAGAPAALDEVLITFGRSAGSAPVLDHAQRSRMRSTEPPVTSKGDDNTGAADDDEALSPAASLQAQDPELRLKALDAVVERGDGSGVDEIQHVLATDPDLDVRTRAVTALARVATPEALEALRRGMADPEMTVRLSVVEAIASFETPRARTLLRDALRDQDEQVSEVAAAALQSLRQAGL